MVNLPSRGLAMMNFKHLLLPKYKHPQAAVRCAAIAQLSPTNAEHKSVLHELAFNDADEQVRLTALQKLNNFYLWWKVAQTFKASRIRDMAFDEVAERLLSNELSTREAATFIRECGNMRFVERLALTSEDIDFKLACLKRLNKPQVNRQCFFATQNEQLQLALLNAFEDIPQLLKALKKTTHARIQAEIEQRLQALRALQIQQQQAQREATVILAKWAEVLRSKLAFADIQQHVEQYQQQLGAETLLTDSQRHTITQLREQTISRLQCAQVITD